MRASRLCIRRHYVRCARRLLIMFDFRMDEPRKSLRRSLHPHDGFYDDSNSPRLSVPAERRLSARLCCSRFQASFATTSWERTRRPTSGRSTRRDRPAGTGAHLSLFEGGLGNQRDGALEKGTARRFEFEIMITDRSQERLSAFLDLAPHRCWRACARSTGAVQRI